MKMEKRRFVHEFVLMFLLALAVGAIVLQSHYNSGLTGYVTSGDYTDEVSCESAGYTWEETCTDISNCVLCDDLETCVETYTEVLCDDLETCQTTCAENDPSCVLCDDLETCVETYTEVLCDDLETCQTTCSECTNQCVGATCGNSVVETGETCELEGTVACENDGGYAGSKLCNSDCLGFGECSSTESCGDAVINGNEECDGNTFETTCIDEGFDNGDLVCDSCSLNTDSCDYDIDEGTSEESSSETDSVATGEIISTLSCTPNWECGDWQECVESIQVRACTDTNSCGNQDGMPETSQACTVEIKETCFDKIKNQDETQVDCGGVCKKCNIFVMAGSAISGPVGKLNTFFSNKTNVFIVSGVLGFLVAGFFVFRFFSKHKLKVSLSEK
jgi:hypothetical protein